MNSIKNANHYNKIDKHNKNPDKKKQIYILTSRKPRPK